MPSHPRRTPARSIAHSAVATPALSTMDGRRLLCTLTDREWEVALLLAQGMTTKEISAALNVSLHTARRHTEHVFLKLGVRSRTMAALRVIHVLHAVSTPTPAAE